MKLAYCGDLCNECPRYIATLSGNKEKLRKVAFLMKKVNWRYDIESPEKMRCRGCEDIDSCEYGVKECCIEKGNNNCGECSDYPCSKIQNAFEITELNREKFRKILTEEEYKMFDIVFFSKKRNLDNIKKTLNKI